MAAVKISSGSRKAAQKFWAPQQDHRPLRKRDKGCGGHWTGRRGRRPLRNVARNAAWNAAGCRGRQPLREQHKKCRCKRRRGTWAPPYGGLSLPSRRDPICIAPVGRAPCGPPWMCGNHTAAAVRNTTKTKKQANSHLAMGVAYARMRRKYVPDLFGRG